MLFPLEVQKMQQLQSQQSKLLDKIDELRTIGVGGLVELPQLIVCGNQSSGKSSVLEAISRVRFPAKSNVCTRFATEVVLRRSAQPKIKVSIEPGESRKNEQERQNLRNFTPDLLSDSCDLPALIEQAKSCMGITDADAAHAGFSDDVLKVEISGPDKTELTLVDLPGLYYSTSRDQDERGMMIVRALTEKYMKNTRSLILAVISAKADYHLQQVLNIAERFDPKRERTLGIITQPDILEVNSEEEDNYLQFLENNKISLRLGWHALRNRSFETREISDDARDQREKAFFEQGRWASVSRSCVGIDSLRHRLSDLLLAHVRRNIPGLVADIKGNITDRQEKLAKLGSGRSTLRQQRGFLLGISSGFERITGQALNGMYFDEFFGGLNDDAFDMLDFRRLRALVRELNEHFAEAMSYRGCRRIVCEPDEWASIAFDVEEAKSNPYMSDWKPTRISRGTLEEEVCMQARKNRGIEFPGSTNHLLVGSLFRDQTKPWEEVARLHLMKTWESVRYYVCLVLQHLTDEDTYSSLLGAILLPELEKMKNSLFDKLGELTAYTKRGHPLPFGSDFLSKVRKSRELRHLVALEKSLGLSGLNSESEEVHKTNADLEQAVSCLELSGDRFAAAEIIDQMQIYYDSSIVTFVDNVAILAIENCLLAPLERIFTCQTVSDMSDEQIQELASERPYVRETRERLGRELEKLQAGLRTFEDFSNTRVSLPQRPFISPSRPPFSRNSYISRRSEEVHREVPPKPVENMGPSNIKVGVKREPATSGPSNAGQSAPAPASAPSSNLGNASGTHQTTNTVPPATSTSGTGQPTAAATATDGVFGLGSPGPSGTSGAGPQDTKPTATNGQPTPAATATSGLFGSGTQSVSNTLGTGLQAPKFGQAFFRRKVPLNQNGNIEGLSNPSQHFSNEHRPNPSGIGHSSFQNNNNTTGTGTGTSNPSGIGSSATGAFGKPNFGSGGTPGSSATTANKPFGSNTFGTNNHGSGNGNGSLDYRQCPSTRGNTGPYLVCPDYNRIDHFQHICVGDGRGVFSRFSPEELRLADYERGDRCFWNWWTY